MKSFPQRSEKKYEMSHFEKKNFAENKSNDLVILELLARN